MRHVDHVQAHQDGGPINETNGQGLCESCNHAKQAAGWHSWIRPGRRHEMEPPLLSATPTDPSPGNLASSTSAGHDRLDLVFGVLLRFAASATQVSAAVARVGPMATLLPEL
ncbi:MAG: endonuclease, partial [Marmoricola sp.]|nr:endonuclease [Marmoricola sp.]